MKTEELLAQAKELISANKLSEAKEFIAAHKDELGEHLGEITKLLGDNSDSIIDKVKGFFSK